jgi:hypothetical protein
VDGQAHEYRAILGSRTEGFGNTGGLAHLSAAGEDVDLGYPVRTQLVSPDTWFELRVACRNVADGVRVTTRVNGIVVRDELDRPGWRREGTIGLSVSGEHADFRIRKLEVRELK